VDKSRGLSVIIPKNNHFFAVTTHFFFIQI